MRVQHGVGFWCSIVLSFVACGGSEAIGEDAEGEAQAAVSERLVDHTAGKACDSDADCENGSCEQELPAFPLTSHRGALPAPGGFCSFPCRLNVDCGEGALCIGAGNTAFSFGTPDERGLCLAACNEGAPCREGYSCVDLFGEVVGAENPMGILAGSCQPPLQNEVKSAPPP